MSDATNGVMAFRPSLALRFWLALGFRLSAYASRPDDDEARYSVHRVITRWNWRDRLRILVSGKTETELCVVTEKVETIKQVRVHATVLWPHNGATDA